VIAAHRARVLQLTRRTLRQAQRVFANSRRALRERAGRARPIIQRGRTRLRQLFQITARVMAQTHIRLHGATVIPDRVVSLFDPEARPIRRGKLTVKTEFGYKALLTENEQSLVTHYAVHQGNPGDGGSCRPPFGDTFSSKAREALLRSCGVRRVSLPYPGRLTPSRRVYEHQRWFKRLQRWRSGQEATISLGSRKYRWRHSRLRGRAGAEIWLGWGIITYNLGRLVTVTAASS
jgi:IS5 family transposase